MNETLSILFVDDEEDFGEGCARWFERKGYRVAQSTSGQDALDLCGHHDFEIAILDWNMPGLSGLELVQRMCESNPDTEIIVLTGAGTIHNAVESMRLGVFDFQTKPFPMDELERRCRAAFERRKLRKENTQLREVITRSTKKTRGMIGHSAPMQKLMALIDRVAPTEKSVLIQGESGTGKELVAAAIHSGSPRSDKPLVTVNCAALPEQLVESELFGHEKGSFTGATAMKPGLFEVADGSTLFIDEIGEMPLALQPKLLRVLEDGSLRRIGSAKERHVDVRIVAATNRNMENEVAEGRFREDLYYRINVMSLELSPLRHRGEDIELLIQHFLGTEFELDEEAQAALLSYEWPGNVRQLINVIERAKILADDQLLTMEDLPKELQRPPIDHEAPLELAGSLQVLQRDHITEVLLRENGNKSKTARVLGIERRKLYRMMKSHGIG
ncbi:Response regulator of zinc sigma-54-dependent two-component system [Rhodopirellula islandica]|uniref:Response regulator of zinc sigma-54-dependent two-component system n=1 Tax=Rhodopirellula islandica TaxID=595434 RepID=A0A0J1BG83_RHOIS|nr:sigma-54 dependent transcriptional regulator [Rhodopirellula islandica]KLU05555.1 Response regulator of zinc sigma-54-dependent two-component system [Rhodopirellula islandica]